MNIKSCENCGIVIDIDRLFFPSNIYGDDGAIRDDLALWNGEEYIPYLLCPVCESPIAKSE